MSDVSEYLAVYLGDPGTVPGIGSERGKKPMSGIGRYKSPHGSVRYVWYEHGTPLAALQVVTRDGKQATIANVYTVPARRRGGLAAALLAKARRDFKKVEHAEEAHLSSEGRAWREKLEGGPRRHHSTITKAPSRSKKSAPRCGWIPDEDAYEVARDFAFNWTTGGAIKQACIPAISIRSSPIEDVAAFNSLVKALGDPTTARKVPPLVVERARTGTDYRIVDGRHRLAAANKHGFARVPVIIVEGGG